ncbi:MAG TPA: hypothetical protein VNA20_05445 [Frankiaceae bacterium]|nr:hypothetical protein [Frankiaceae bacterium]
MTRVRTLLPVVAALAAVAVVTAPSAPRPDAPLAVSQRAQHIPTAGELGPQPVPGDLALLRTAGKTAVVPQGAYARARAQARATAARTRAAAPASVARVWELHGPQHIGGRVLDVVIDPLRPDSVYAATATGGIWHSTDKGMTYRPVWPDDYVQTIGALAITPDGTLFAGTGEAGPGGGSLTYGGDGVHRSRDGGKTWQNVGIKNSERIGRIVVDPKNPKRIYVAANGPLFSTGGDRGLYRSDDGGDTWNVILAGKTGTTGAVDVAVDPDDSNTIYVAMWDRLRKPDSRDYTGGGSALYRSTDGGESWAPVGQQFFGPDVMTVGRMGVALAPGGIVYVLTSTVNGLTGGFYVSTDGGDTFTPKSFDSELVTGGFVYAWWFGRVYVDPKDPQHVFATGVNLSESRDGGTTFTAPSGLHADQHGMAWDPRVEDRVYIGNDGGMYRSDDNGRSWEHGTYMPWNQLFSIDVSQQRPQRIVGGLQDNGGVRSWDADGDVTVDSWNDVTGGDGTEMRINPQNDEIIYGCSQYGACMVSKNGGNNRQAFDEQIIGNRKNWLTPIEFDPADPSTVYTASSIVHRSEDDGASWRPISPDLTKGETGSLETNPLFRNYNTVSTLAVSPADVGFILAGTDDGRLWYSHDNAASLTSWTESTDSDLPDHYVTSVAIDSQNHDVAYASFSGFRWGEERATVYRSGDKGANWDDVSGDLPQSPVNKVLPVGKDLFVATDVGVFWTPDVEKNLGKKWFLLGEGLPQTPMWDLAYQAKENALYAASFGRGAYSVTLNGLVPQLPVPPRVPPGERPPAGGNTGGGGDGGNIPSTGLPATLPLAALAACAAGALAARRRRAG